MNIPPKYEDVVAQLALEREQEESTLGELEDLVEKLNNALVEIDALQQRLTVAEQLLREVLESGDWFRSALEFINGEGLEVREKIEASLKPAAEPEHICEGCGSKGWTANCNQCVPY